MISSNATSAAATAAALQPGTNRRGGEEKKERLARTKNSPLIAASRNSEWNRICGIISRKTRDATFGERRFDSSPPQPLQLDDDQAFFSDYAKERRACFAADSSAVIYSSLYAFTRTCAYICFQRQLKSHFIQKRRAATVFLFFFCTIPRTVPNRHADDDVWFGRRTTGASISISGRARSALSRCVVGWEFWRARRFATDCEWNYARFAKCCYGLKWYVIDVTYVY